MLIVKWLSLCREKHTGTETFINNTKKQTEKVEDEWKINKKNTFCTWNKLNYTFFYDRLNAAVAFDVASPKIIYFGSHTVQ